MAVDAINLDRQHGGANTEGLIDFSVSINPLGPPPSLFDAYHRAAATITAYPEPYAETLTAAIAGHLGVAPQNVLAGSGSTQLFYLIARVLRPSRPAVVIPTFSEIANSLLSMSLAPIPIALRRERGFQFDLSDMLAAVDKGAGALYFGRPNSPTGSRMEFADVSAVAQRCASSGCWCVIDEAFLDFADDPRSAVALITEYERLIVLRSMTKLYAIPGLRLGYLVAAQRVAAQLARALEPWSVSGPAAAVGLECLAQPKSWSDQIRESLRCEREYVEQELGKIPAIEVFASTCNFIMFAVRAGSRPLTQHLGESGIVVRDLTMLPGAGPGLYRIGVRSRPDNDRLIEALASFD
jgi:threonine-phosphate decarboxylase